MPLELYIPSCIDTPAHSNHLPPPDKPLRIQIEGPIVSIEKLLPTYTVPSSEEEERKAPAGVWPLDVWNLGFPQPAGKILAELAFKQVYGREARFDIAGDIRVRDEYLGWVQEIPLKEIDYYGVTFDHLVRPDDIDPEVLQINIIEVDDDEGEYARKYLRFAVDSRDYTGTRVLAVPRCCVKRKGTQDRGRVNDMVVERDSGRR